MYAFHVFNFFLATCFIRIRYYSTILLFARKFFTKIKNKFKCFYNLVSFYNIKIFHFKILNLIYYFLQYNKLKRKIILALWVINRVNIVMKKNICKLRITYSSITIKYCEVNYSIIIKSINFIYITKSIFLYKIII